MCRPGPSLSLHAANGRRSLSLQLVDDDAQASDYGVFSLNGAGGSTRGFGRAFGRRRRRRRFRTVASLAANEWCGARRCGGEPENQNAASVGQNHRTRLDTTLWRIYARPFCITYSTLSDIIVTI